MYVIHAGVYVIPAEMSIVIIPEVYPRVFSIIRVQPRPVFKNDVLQYNILYHNGILSDLEVPVCILPHVIMYVQYI